MSQLTSDPVPRDQAAQAPIPRQLGAFFLAAVAVAIVDVVTKLLVYRNLDLGRGPVPILGDWVRLTYIHNPGAAFGLFQGNRWFFVAVSVLSVAILVSLALSGRYRDRWIQASFGLILGGAVGNLIDRLWLGVVIDFLDVGVGFHRWPVFNVADIGVTLGVLLLAARLLVFEDRARREPRDPRIESGPESADGVISPESPRRGR